MKNNQVSIEAIFESHLTNDWGYSMKSPINVITIVKNAFNSLFHYIASRSIDGSLIHSRSDDGTIVVIPIFLFLDASFDADSKYSSFTGQESSETGLTTDMGRSGGIMIEFHQVL